MLTSKLTFKLSQTVRMLSSLAGWHHPKSSQVPSCSPSSTGLSITHRRRRRVMSGSMDGDLGNSSNSGQISTLWSRARADASRLKISIIGSVSSSVTERLHHTSSTPSNCSPSQTREMSPAISIRMRTSTSHLGYCKETSSASVTGGLSTTPSVLPLHPEETLPPSWTIAGQTWSPSGIGITLSRTRSWQRSGMVKFMSTNTSLEIPTPGSTWTSRSSKGTKWRSSVSAAPLTMTVMLWRLPWQLRKQSTLTSSKLWQLTARMLRCYYLDLTIFKGKRFH